MINKNKTPKTESVAEEFSIGNMAPVVPVTGDVLSKNEVAKPAKLDTSVEDGEEDSISKSIATEFDALDMMVPGTGVTEEDSDNNADESECESVKFEDEDIAFAMTEASDKDIDEDIKPLIDKLNDKGYKTKYSCSGHPSARVSKDKFRDGVLHNKLYSTARIIFGDNYDLSAPKGWEKKVLNDGENFSIYVKPPTFKILDGLPKDAFYKWKKKYMDSLESWVNDLPKAGEVPETTGEDIEESVLNDILIDVM